MRDSQQGKVYKWEHRVRMTHPTPTKDTLAAKRTYHTIAVNMYGERSAKVMQHRGRRRSYYYNFRQEIRFRADADLWSILHESAHHVLLVVMDTTGHHALFVRVLIDMAVAFKIAPEETLLRMAHESGVWVAPKSDVPRPVLDTLPKFLREEV